MIKMQHKRMTQSIMGCNSYLQKKNYSSLFLLSLEFVYF